MPRMIVIAGPPAGGKSTAFPASSFGVEFFNADDRAAELNAGSYRAIPPEIRAKVNAAFEAFVAENIRTKSSFALETTLRTDITLRQAADAKHSGFTVAMKYLAAAGAAAAQWNRWNSFFRPERRRFGAPGDSSYGTPR